MISTADVLWQDAFEKEYAEALAKTDVPTSEWRAGGRATKENPNKEDLAWWNKQGPKMVQAYIDWRASVPDWQIAAFRTGSKRVMPVADHLNPDVVPAIELDLRCNFGRVPVRAIIDRVFINGNGDLIVVDLKSGANMPTDQGLQLGFYAAALEVNYGVRPAWCAFWDARKGGLTEPVNVDRFTPELLGEMLDGFDKARRQGLFIPNLNRMCGTCGVRDHCLAYGGSKAKDFDPLYQKVRNASD